ncbi:hypothetical protein [Phytoactinopolyspora halotolerans]|uniref:Restriction endonuclease n=1 Tax=Phytoactinopolyspora halotolerans TaxID=1981512 RepID=A0A6L9S0V0_9ACTN|nr:hypothetical protein [Phytoactinopolyspora halotolerans]NED98785.1 hypothetical protein [Phytoactinopolyspora halotolerans]
MVSKDDVFDSFEAVISERGATNPWEESASGHRVYHPDYELLAALLAIPLREGRGSESGRLAKGIDAWVAHELRRAGFPADEVWPRLTKPRVLPREVGIFLDRLPKSLRNDVHAHLLKNKTVAPSEARVLGRAYVKQVDVLVSQWARGPELLVSTKSMVSSFRNNLPNRFEESYGDAKNLRGRYPLVSMGFLFVMRSTILDDPGAFEKAVDMLRKLQGEADAYDATCVVLAEWSDDAFDGVRIRTDQVPDDLSADRFLRTLIEAVLTRTPVEMHVEVRERREHRELPLEEPDTGALIKLDELGG